MSDIIEFLTRKDTCTVSNAIETFEVRMRNEGYMQDTARCRFPQMGPVAGYAIVGRIRTTVPPISGLIYYQNIKFWEYIDSVKGPKIIVLKDMDKAPGTGAFFGEIHAQIARALGCVAYISNGAVRDLPALEALNFQCFSGCVAVSHAYGHLVEFGEAIEIGGLKVNPGDLLHADQHGMHQIPLEIVDRLPGAVADVEAREAELIRLCKQRDFTIDKLKDALR
ncbi:MAG TPA: RraA family protein [Bryobacteraceae bacterium]|nr:RraA family protein [Bryobacteraceae bacterium]